MEEATLNRVLYVLLGVVVWLFYGEIRRAWETRQQTMWDDRYIDAVRAGPEEWAFGWRLEDLESRLHMQRHWGEALRARVDTEGGALARVIEDPTSLFTMECASRSGRLVQVGPDEFRDMSDRCRAFSSLDAKLVGPHALWEIVPLDGDDGSVGFRSFSNGKFLRARAPPLEAAWNSPWLLETVSPLPGLAERFQLRKRAATFSELAEEAESLLENEQQRGAYDAANNRASADEDPGVMIYSELMRGYLQCSGGSVSEPVRGFAGESLLDETSPDYYFNLTRATVAIRDRATKLLRASRHVKQTRDAYDLERRPPPVLSAGGKKKKSSSLEKKKLKIALCVPMTSRGTEMEGVDQSPLWFNLFASFVESIDWHKNRHEFVFYLGFDRGDALYDTGDAWSELRGAFKIQAKKALKWLGYGNWTIRRVVDVGRNKGGAPDLSLRLFHFDDTLGAPSQAVSGLARRAVSDGADYVYQLNDDTILVSKDWLEILVESLRASPLAPNLGVAGPLDTNNERILTHAFVHRTHLDVFDAMFPPAFRNWWSDDWISAVYGARATFARKDVVVTHNVQSQKTGAWNRYDVDHAAELVLRDQVQRGFVQINAWLRDRGHPTMPLPDICGYAPMMTRIYDTLMRHGL
ncbi:hypothetical protein CTAYLR_003043 [Chrysophaeum taylorii]|uniref:Uncharacterized protein n=1 Tax=Chrysophaeum taylorii TaxID=2483200 RepID=A0AAD7XHK2_9STRA|nr:hypothetical protein CTAYLR_003043 [Chrysophaeum taylorii]